MNTGFSGSIQSEHLKNQLEQDSLIFDIKNWVDDHFTSGVALKKKEKYERKVKKLTSRFQ